jgi:hypothetical protein
MTFGLLAGFQIGTIIAPHVVDGHGSLLIDWPFD